MDTSSEYIKMCKKAEEIQVHKFQEGDYYYADDWEFGHPLLEGQTFLAFDSDNWDGDVSYITRCNKRTVWLPRQDQLQILSGLSWQEFDKECLKYDAATKEQAGIKVVMERLAKR